MFNTFFTTLMQIGDSTSAVRDPIGGDIRSLILTIITYAIGLAGVIAVAFIIIGGFQYITSQGNDDQTKRAVQTLTYAVIGLIIVFASYAIVNTVLTNVLG